ncbi:MAG: response regulator transcription factor [Gaiellaceae bacterium]
MGQALLLVEPEAEERAFLERHLRSDGFEVVGVAAAGEALAAAERARPDLILLGIPLADASALDVCGRIRSRDRRVPVIVLDGGDGDTIDRVRAFDRGCDDWLARPFDYQELLARIRAVLRRAAPDPGERLAAGAIAVDRATRRVTVQGEAVVLAGKEYELLCKLASAPTRVFPKEQLLREVWGFLSSARTRTVDSHASRLRRKLAAAGGGECVINIWGVGYKLLEEL